eukprot:TRINITY_DN9734_c0_g1_i1.p1 TRINITY_DN9734_c0_g1~~TRINITY_DN9734_c0_g1_i1.p1  ORF type:complete len:282 (-),score=65.16 TRINITY_DN9734_c0_g1_i1:76-888(-)
MGVPELYQKFTNEFKPAYEMLSTNPNSPDLMDQCKQLMTDLRIGLLDLDIKLPSQYDPDVIDKEIYLSREILEYGAIMSVLNRDDKGLENYVAQLKSFYNDYRFLPDSEKKDSILGLYLLYLLSNNRIGEFHTELELIPDQNNKYVNFSVTMERDKMEGRYNKIFQAHENLDGKGLGFYSPLTEKLCDTVRNDIADSLETAYESLSIGQLQQLLLLDTDISLNQFISERGWNVVDNVIHFSTVNVLENELDALEIIGQSLQYAHELERII